MLDNFVGPFCERVCVSFFLSPVLVGIRCVHRRLNSTRPRFKLVSDPRPIEQNLFQPRFARSVKASFLSFRSLKKWRWNVTMSRVAVVILNSSYCTQYHLEFQHRSSTFWNLRLISFKVIHFTYNLIIPIKCTIHPNRYIKLKISQNLIWYLEIKVYFTIYNNKQDNRQRSVNNNEKNVVNDYKSKQ